VADFYASKLTRDKDLMSRSPEVSVVVPCFNDGRFLAVCLKSVSNQTLQPIETLIIDDGSTDHRTKKVLGRINGPGLRVIHQENFGLAGARNTGIRNARGRYIYFLDVDNILMPDCLAQLSYRLEQNKHAIAGYSKIRFLNGPERGHDWGEPYNPYVLLTHNQWDAGIMLRSEAIPKYNLWYDESMRYGYEDWEFHIRLSSTNAPILYCPDALYQYRVRRKSLLSTSHSRHAEILGYIKTKHQSLFSEQHLLNAKRAHAPALMVLCSIDQKHAVSNWLERQTFQDWVLDQSPSRQNSPITARYQMFIRGGVENLDRLPVEALEATIMSLESNSRVRDTLMAVKCGRPSWLASGGERGRLHLNSTGIALISRTSGESGFLPLQTISSSFDSLTEFPDQRPPSSLDSPYANSTFLSEHL
jgi:glycosyltransferase involved in cell wall biosynthesis